MIDHTFYRFLSVCQGNWRSSVYISTGGPDCLLSANRDGRPIVMPVLKDLLTALDVVSANRYMTLANQDEVDIYVIYMTYRVQQDLYQVCQESGLLRNLSWDDFVLLMRGHKPARAAAMVVARETLKEFYLCGNYILM